VAGVTESWGQKSDKRDAYGLAEQLRTGSLDEQIFEAPWEFTLLRELSRAHITATRDLVRVQSRPKGRYRSRGVQTPGASVYSPAQRDAWENRLPNCARRRTTQRNEQVDFFRERKKQIEADLLQESRQHKIPRILKAAPGIGPIRAVRLVPIVVTPLCPHCVRRHDRLGRIDAPLARSGGGLRRVLPRAATRPAIVRVLMRGVLRAHDFSPGDWLDHAPNLVQRSRFGADRIEPFGLYRRVELVTQPES
jgi:hypothetical protein